MQTPQVHCKVDEKMMSYVVFFTRFITGGVLLYVSAGCLLYYREFLFNAAAINCPFPLAWGFVIMQLLLALLLLLGWMTRWAAGLSVLCAACTACVFFGSNFNKVYIALILLQMAALLPAALLGPGRISLDFMHARKRAEKQFRG